ncbi:uncharacterized protein DMENIID0001_130720 [Sergentomyia squamirostris]
MSVIGKLLVISLVFTLVPRFSDSVLEHSVLLAQDQMVDLTNQMGFRILYYHSLANRNNVALSPCGLTSVLVALYEGSDGQSALEIRDTLELPWERDIIRVGFRDIHRRLRSYFYNQENLLSGLSLSKENVTIRPEYETLLRFYGYDLMTGMMQTSTETTESTTEEAKTTPLTTSEETTTTTEEITTTTEEIIESTTIETTTSPETTTTERTTTVEEETMETTTIGPTRTTKYIFTFTPPSLDPEEDNTTEMSSTMSSTTLESSTLESSTRDVEETTSPGGNLAENGESTTTEISLGRRRRRKPKRQSRLINYVRRRRSPIEFVIPEIDARPPFVHYRTGAVTPNPQYLVQPYQLTEDSREEVDLFYLSRFESAQVPYKFFNTIMKFAYLESIQSTVLEVELDSENYNLLLILPDYYYGLDRLLAAMKTRFVPNIRELRTEILQPTWIKAMIPKFFLHGRIVLTNDLQNMGILDIFEPTRANFSPMTDDEGIYTRHVEQAITVNIRIQANDNLKRYSSYYKTPVEVAINRPFLFVVADKENHLAIIAGTVLNPLNSRIQ